MKEYIKPYNEKLNEIGCEIIFRRLWCILPISETYEEKRVPFAKGYYCDFSILFFEKGKDPEDEDVEDCIGFQFLKTVTSYRTTYFRNHGFIKFNIDCLYKEIYDAYREVIEKGLDEASKKYNN